MVSCHYIVTSGYLQLATLENSQGLKCVMIKRSTLADYTLHLLDKSKMLQLLRGMEKQEDWLRHSDNQPRQGDDQ